MGIAFTAKHKRLAEIVGHHDAANVTRPGQVRGDPSHIPENLAANTVVGPPSLELYDDEVLMPIDREDIEPTDLARIELLTIRVLGCVETETVSSCPRFGRRLRSRSRSRESDVSIPALSSPAASRATSGSALESTSWTRPSMTSHVPVLLWIPPPISTVTKAKETAMFA